MRILSFIIDWLSQILMMSIMPILGICYLLDTLSDWLYFQDTIGRK